MREAIGRGVSGWRAAFGLFLLTLAVLLSLRFVFPQEPAKTIQGAIVTSPVLMFEFARTPADLDAVFGEPGDAARPARIAAMDEGNRADYALALSYGLFMLSFFAAAARETGSSRWMVFAGAGVAAAVADAVENNLLLEITANLAAPGSAPGIEVAWLAVPVWTKFTLLALCCAGAGAFFLRQKRPVLALLCLPAVLFIGPAIAFPLQFGAFAANAIGLGWLAMGIYAALKVPNAL